MNFMDQKYMGEVDVSTEKVHFFHGLNKKVHPVIGLWMEPSDFFRKALDYFVRKEKVIKQVDLADRMGVDKRQVNDYLGGRTNWSEDKRMQACSIIKKNYLEMLNIGKALGEGKQISTQQSFRPAPSPLIVHSNNEPSIEYLKEHSDHYRGVPLYESGQLAAGIGGYTFDESEDPGSAVVIYRPEIRGRTSHDLRALRVGGDSMEPIIPRKSIVIVDLNDREFSDRKIFVVREPFSDPPEAMVKRVRKLDQANFQGFALVSENTEKHLPVVTDLEWYELVVGRVVWMWRNVEDA
jgi:phage repressor protein C with HTH and peptisase S24 domain